MKKIRVALCAAAALTLASGLALAGYTNHQQVTISGQNAQGSVVGTRNSSDSVQQIWCNTYSYDTGSESGSCYAKNSAGTVRQCFYSNDDQLEVMRSVGPASWISFTIGADGSHCSFVSVTTGSSRAQY